MSDLKVSIVTPNYNYAQYIGETIESVLEQDYKNIELIIVDDGSTDNSVDIISKYVLKYPGRIRLFKQANKGQTPSINRGLRNTTGDIIGWINSDDTYCSNVISNVAKHFRENSNTDIVYGDVNITDIKGNRIYIKRHLRFNYYSACFNRFTNTLTSNTVFWRRSTMVKNGYLIDDFKCNMDGEFFSRLTRGMKVVHLSIPIANFRRQPFTKASENNPNWIDIMNKEHLYEQERSYHYQPIAKYIPYKYSIIIKIFYRLQRVFLRAIKLHYFKQWHETQNYKRINENRSNN